MSDCFSSKIWKTSKVFRLFFRDTVFEQALVKAALAKLPPEELDNYERNLKVYQDYKNTVDFTLDEGKAEGRMEEKKTIARALKNGGVPVVVIAQTTGLTEAEIARL